MDVPVTEHRAFVFAADRHGPIRRVRTLREFVAALEGTAVSSFDGYLRRGDFSRWIGDVFGDHAMAQEVREKEERYRLTTDLNTIPEIAAIIRARYDLTSESDRVGGAAGASVTIAASA